MIATGATRAITLGAALLITALCSGCATKARQTFPGHNRELLWTALVAAAETPDYNHPDYTQRWIVQQNDVAIMEESGRIEIYRRLERELHRPHANPLHETRTFKLGVQLEQSNPKKQPDLYGAKLTSRAHTLPTHFWDEADRYFSDVRDVLGEQAVTASAQDAPAIDPASDPSKSPAAAMYDD